MGMRLCLVSRPQIVRLDYMGDMKVAYIQCESGLALASFLPPVFDRNVLQAIKNWRREWSGNETSLAPCRPSPVWTAYSIIMQKRREKVLPHETGRDRCSSK